VKGGKVLDDVLIWITFDADKNQGLELFIEKYKIPLYKLCINLYKNKTNAEDLFQDTWIKAFKYMNDFDRNKNFEPWLFTIAINLFKDNYRKLKRWFSKSIDFLDITEKDSVMDSIKSTTYIPEESFDNNQNKEQLRKAINNLKDDFRMVIILFYYNGLKQKEISEILEIPEGTVKSRLNKAKKLLKEYMEGNNYGG
jgi:RNA polymerase sigma-70 factor (ECF subfamily)